METTVMDCVPMTTPGTDAYRARQWGGTIIVWGLHRVWGDDVLDTDIIVATWTTDGWVATDDATPEEREIVRAERGESSRWLCADLARGAGRKVAR